MTPPAKPPGAPRSPVYAIVGNPNCGKSTLFNALTGLKQRVGNYPGVTVEKKTGTLYSQHGQPITVIDLPGSYSLAARSPDEAVTRDVLLGRRTDTPQPDRVLCIVDTTNLERNLYLVHQVLDLGRPVILILNMMDLVAQAGLSIRAARLEQMLGIPVIPCEAANGKGIIELKLAMSRHDLPLPRHAWDIPAAIASAVAELQASLVANGGKAPLIARAEALLLLTDQDSVRVAGSTPLDRRTEEILRSWQKRWEAEGMDWAGTLVSSRYEVIGRLAAEVVQTARVQTPTPSDRIDAIVTHPVWGWLALGAVMTLLFVSIFQFAQAPMDWIANGNAALANWIKRQMPEGDLRNLLTDGVIGGVGTIVMFLPQILILFFFIGLLESTGYMARAAFIMDCFARRSAEQRSSPRCTPKVSPRAPRRESARASTSVGIFLRATRPALRAASFQIRHGALSTCPTIGASRVPSASRRKLKEAFPPASPGTANASACRSLTRTAPSSSSSTASIRTAKCGSTASTDRKST